MKKIILLVVLVSSSISFGQNESNTNVGTFVEKTSTDLGKILDFRASMLSIKNLNTNSTENRLVVETKGFASNDVKNIELDKAGVMEMINTMKNLKSKYFASLLTNNIEVSYTSPMGHEIGGTFVLDKPATTAPVTKKEKYYIDTKEKYYEGKIVNHDAGGPYIWKEVTSTATKEVSGKWVPFIRLNNNSSKTTFNLTMEEFESFLKFLEENGTKL